MPDGCEHSIRGPLCYLLSRRSAFVTGQVLDVLPERPAMEGMGADLTDRVAVVTGASRGIGRATAVRLAEEGARVYCLDLPDQKEVLESLAKDISGVALPMDITGDSAALDIHQAVGASLDILIHNAGITRDKTLARMTDIFWDQAMDVNLIDSPGDTRTSPTKCDIGPRTYRFGIIDCWDCGNWDKQTTPHPRPVSLV